MFLSVPRFLRNSGAALLFLVAVEVFAEEAPHCNPSLFLPPVLHLLEATECFSLEVAERVSSNPDALYAYLSRFPETAVADSYRYWYYLRTQRFLPALLTLLRIVNGSLSLEPAYLFRDDLAFVVLNGIKNIPSEIDLYGEGQDCNDENASHRFFFILDQVASFYAADSSDLRRDAWLLYRSLVLFFSSTGVPCSDDRHTDLLLKHFYRLLRDGNLLAYLDFYAFFTGGGGDYLPSAETYARRFSQLVPLPKIEKLRDEKKMLASVSRLVARHVMESLAVTPRLELVETDDIHRWYRTTHPDDPSYASHSQQCRLFDERDKMLSPYKEDLLQPLTENRALALMEWCDRRHLPPMVIEGTKIYLSNADRWFSDAAIAYGLIMWGSFSYREASGLMRGALLSALRRYLTEGNKRPFGEILRYAYHTGRLSLLCDALFLHRKYQEDPDYTEKVKQSVIRFTVLFFEDSPDRDR